MNKYMGWVLYDEPPEGFSIDRHTGSPLSGYDFYTNGRSILNGGIRILVKASGVPVDSMTEPKEGPMISREVRQRVNAFARESFKVKLLQEIEFDLLVCRLEGWNMESYVCEIKGLIDDIFQKMIK